MNAIAIWFPDDLGKLHKCNVYMISLMTWENCMNAIAIWHP